MRRHANHPHASHITTASSASGTTSGWSRVASATSPRASAVAARVMPHVGHVNPNTRRETHTDVAGSPEGSHSASATNAIAVSTPATNHAIREPDPPDTSVELARTSISPG